MPPPSDGLEDVFPQLRRIGDYAKVILSGVGHRTELACIEFAEARDAALIATLWIVGALMLVMLGVATLTACIAAAFWDTPHRLTVLALMGFGYLAAAAAAFFFLRRKLTEWQPFAETSEQIRKDTQCIQDLIQPR